jgi:hypothetical protein
VVWSTAAELHVQHQHDISIPRVGSVFFFFFFFFCSSHGLIFQFLWKQASLSQSVMTDLATPLVKKVLGFAHAGGVDSPHDALEMDLPVGEID